MASYKQIQEYVNNEFGYIPKTCWIAHVKEICGLPLKGVHNRQTPLERIFPCPVEKQNDLKEAFKHFKMID